MIHQERLDTLFKQKLWLSGCAVLALMVGILLTLVIYSLPALIAFKWEFLTQGTWDPMTNQFGAKPFVVGTLLTAFIALLLSIPFSFSISILLGEYLKQGFWAWLFKTVIDLLAGIPSVVYGLWGLFVLVPWVRAFEMYAGLTPFGIGIFTASLILALMIIPYAAAIGRDVINLVPTELKEGAYSLGATRWEVIKTVVVPYAKSGLFAGLLLSLGRAIGETMAVTMVIGNANEIPSSLLGPGNTMASIIANEFSEATGALHTASLIEMGLYLLLITAVINLLGRWIINRATHS
jgi:phosphate transport system permease protein